MSPPDDVRWTRKDLLGIAELTPAEIALVLDTAESFREVADRPAVDVAVAKRGDDLGALPGCRVDLESPLGLARGLRARARMAAAWNTPRAARDEVHRAGWIGFDEYYDQPAEPQVAEPGRRPT